jgi:hypothetical protein
LSLKERVLPSGRPWCGALARTRILASQDATNRQGGGKGRPRHAGAGLFNGSRISLKN